MKSVDQSWDERFSAFLDRIDKPTDVVATTLGGALGTYVALEYIVPLAMDGFRFSTVVQLGISACAGVSSGVTEHRRIYNVAASSNET